MNDSNLTVRFKIYVVKRYDLLFLLGKPCSYSISMFHRAFFNSIIDEYQHMHFFTFNTVLV